MSSGVATGVYLTLAVTSPAVRSATFGVDPSECEPWALPESLQLLHWRHSMEFGFTGSSLGQFFPLMPE